MTRQLPWSQRKGGSSRSAPMRRILFPATRTRGPTSSSAISHGTRRNAFRFRLRAASRTSTAGSPISRPTGGTLHFNPLPRTSWRETRIDANPWSAPVSTSSFETVGPDARCEYQSPRVASKVTIKAGAARSPPTDDTLPSAPLLRTSFPATQTQGLLVTRKPLIRSPAAMSSCAISGPDGLNASP